MSTTTPFDRQPQSWLTVILFTDLVDSSALARQLGAADYVAQVLEPHNLIFRQTLQQYPRAREIKHLGDGFMATFDSTSDAVDFALRFHAQLQSAAWEQCKPQTRVGIHLGEAVEFAGRTPTERDLTGDVANVAARLMGLAEPGQTLLSRAAFDSARPAGRIRAESFERDTSDGVQEVEWLNHGPYKLKGVDEPLEVCEVGLKTQAPLRAPRNSEKATRLVRDPDAELLGWRPSPGGAIPHRQSWTLLRSLGAGGFGEVWLGKHSRTREQRAFKFCFNPDRLRTFKRELTFFRLIRDHLGNRPDINRLYEINVERPPYFLEAEYVCGGDMKQWAERRGGIGTVSLDERLRLLAAIARAVAAAHSLGIIHKDLKPSNVLIADDGERPQPQLTDFGIGVLADRSLLANHQITETGFTESLVLHPESNQTGTRLYQPPEAQLNRAATTAGDVYALGVMLYQLVTADFSRPLGVGWEEDIPDPFLREDIQACTHRDPDRRIAGAAELAERLESLAQRRIAKQQELEARRATERMRRLVASLVVASVLVVALGGLCAVSYLNWKRALDSEQSAQQGRDDANRARAQAEASAAKAREQERIAQQRFALAERSAYNLQLRRIQEVLHDEPGVALRLLEDESLCPEHLRDFTWRYFHDALSRNFRRLRGHKGPVRSVAFCPDNLRLVTGGYDGNLRVWNLASGRITGTHRVGDEIESLALSHDGTRVAVCVDRSVHILEIESGDRESSHSCDEAFAMSVCFSPDRKRIAVGDSHGTIRVWDLAELGDPILLRGHEDSIHSVVYNHDGTRLASASHDQTARVWDVSTGESAFTLEGHTGCVRDVAFAPDAARIATCSEDQSTIVWDAATGKQMQRIPAQGWASNVAFSPDGSTLIVCSGEGQLELRAMTADGVEAEIKTAHKQRSWGLDVSKNGRYVAISSLDGEVSVHRWDGLVQRDRKTSQASLITGLPGAADMLAISPNGEMLLAVEEDSGSASIWRLSDATKIVALQQHQGLATCAAFSPDGTQVATGGDDRVIKLWNAVTGEELVELVGHSGFISHLVYSSAGDKLLSSSENRDESEHPGDVLIWNVADRTIEHRLEGIDTEIWCFDVSPDGKRLVSGGGFHYGIQGGTLELWNLKSLEREREISTGAFVTSVSYSPDGETIASADVDGRIALWQAETLQFRQSVEGHAQTVHQVRFSPDGQVLASAGHDQTVRLWDPVTGHERAALAGHRGCVRSLCFSADGKTLYTGSEDRTIQAWGQSPASGVGQRPYIDSFPLTGHVGIVSSIVFHSDGKTIASAGEDDKTIRLWDTEDRTPVAVLYGHQDCPRKVLFDAAGRLFSTGADSMVCVWDLDKGAPAQQFPGHSKYAAAIAISRDGRTIATGSEDKQGGGELFLWDESLGKKAAELLNSASAEDGVRSPMDQGSQEVWCLAISPDQQLLVSGGGAWNRGEMHLWDPIKRRHISRLGGHSSRVVCVAFSPDGNKLASADWEGQVCITDVKSRRLLTSFTAHGDIAFCAAYSPDGRLLATSGNDWLIRIWDANDHHEIATLEDHGGAVRSIAFSPDGMRLASACEDQTIRVWNLRAVYDQLPQ